MFCVCKFYFVEFNGMFTSFQVCQIWQPENPCAWQIEKNIIFQNKALLVLFFRQIKHFGTNFIILNSSESRNNDEKFGLFVAVEVNGSSCTCRLGW